MDDSLTLLYDHYKETCSNLSASLKKRESSLLLVVVTLAAFGFQALSPNGTMTALRGYLQYQYGLETAINFDLVNTAVWFLLLVFSLRYFQVSVHIERQYDYIHSLEEKINQKVGEDLITREGKSYLSDYPHFSDWVWLLYTILFPLILFTASFANILREWLIVGCSKNIFTILNTVFFLFIAITILLYLVKIHYRKKEVGEKNSTE